MKYKRYKNGNKISVADWANEIVITNKATGKVIGRQTFGDHVIAVRLAKQL